MRIKRRVLTEEHPLLKMMDSLKERFGKEVSEKIKQLVESEEDSD